MELLLLIKHGAHIQISYLVRGSCKSILVVKLFILLYCIHDLQRGIPCIKLSIVLQICTQRFLQVTTCKMRLVRRRLYPVQCYISTCLTSYQEWHQPSPHQSTPAAQTERRTEQAICPLVDSSHLSVWPLSDCPSFEDPSSKWSPGTIPLPGTSKLANITEYL